MLPANGFSSSLKLNTTSQWLTALALATTVALTPVSAWAVPVASSQTAAFAQAKAQYDKGNIQGALEGFQKVAGASSGSDEANLWLAKALMKQGGVENYTQAKNYLIQALTFNADNAEALMHLGTITGWDPSRRSQAIRLLTRALELKNQSPEVAKESVSITQNLVQLLMWDGRYTDAAQFAEPIRQEFAKTPASQAVYASLLSHLGKAPLAVPLYENYIKPFDVQPPNQQSLQWQLDYLYALRYADQQPKARQLFGKVQAGVLANGDANLLNSLGGVAYDLNEFMTSIALTEKLPPDMKANRDVQLRNARAHIKLAQWPEAVTTFDNLYQLGELTAEEKLEFAEVFRGQNLSESTFPKTNYIDGLFRDVASNPKYENDADIQPRLKAYFDSLNANASTQPTVVTTTTSTTTRSSSWGPATGQSSTTTEIGIVKPGAGRNVVERPVVKTTTNNSSAGFSSSSSSAIVERDGAQGGVWGTRTETQATETLVPQSANSGYDTWSVEQATIAPGAGRTTVQHPTVNAGSASSWKKSTASTTTTAIEPYETPAQKTYANDRVRIQSDSGEWANTAQAPLKKTTFNETKPAPQPIHSDGTTSSRIEEAKQLSYDRKYNKSFALFDGVLKEDPANRDARLGKAMALLYSGRKFQAKSILSQLHEQYPGDPEITTSMAELYQSLGRQDKALDLLRDLEPGGIRSNNRSAAPAEYKGRYQGFAAPIDFSIDNSKQYSASASTSSKEAQQIESDLEALNAALSALDTLQSQSEDDLQQLKGQVWDTRQSMTESKVIDVAFTESDAATSKTGRIAPRLVDTATPLQREADAYLYGQSMTESQDPSAQTLPPYLKDRLSNLQNQLYSDLRPELRTGFAYQIQDGNRNLNKLNIWEVPTQLSVSLLPSLRVRGGITPQRYYLPKANISPKSNFGLLYSMGANAKLGDRITVDGDVGLLQLTTSNDLAFNYRARLILDPWDRVRFQLGSKRLTLANSLQSVAGLKANAGSFAGDKLGPANETSIFAELNLIPFTNVDVNVLYELGFIGGNNIDSNTKNQVFASAGYTHRFNEKHWARLGYQFLWMNFDKNTTNGYYDVTQFGGTSPVVGMNPSVAANPGFGFGGYFSPANFFLNAIRLDYHGSAFDRFMEYQLGGSIGLQSFSQGSGITDSSPNTVAYQADAAVRLNWTDWLSSYGRFALLDSGGVFTRYRFEGGLILRPYIEALSPVFGEKTPKDDNFRKQDSKFPFNYDIHSSYY